MGVWQDSLIYYRDFGYPDSLRRLLSMAHNVGDASAKTFAEYVTQCTVARMSRGSSQCDSLWDVMLNVYKVCCPDL